MGLNNFGIVAKNLSRSAQPDKNGMSTLEKFGVKEILKLNSDHEYPVALENSSSSIALMPFPLNAFKPDEAMTRNIAQVIQSNLLSGIATHVHCSHGRDRTGLVIGAWQLLYGGSSLDEVMAERKCYGTNWVLDIPDHEILEMLAKFAAERS